tara:strand:- start:1789 stop:2052 length:264 start_codon:yes stop_codon:yes gene_type:complete
MNRNLNRRTLRKMILEELRLLNENQHGFGETGLGFDPTSGAGMIDSFIEWAHANGIGDSLSGRSNPGSPLYINIPGVGKFEIVALEQ